MRVLIGMPDPTSRGGPNACEPPFVAALRGLGIDVVETTFIYGDELDATALTTRIRRVARSAWRLRRLARRERVDVLHLNTSFDTRTVLRDAFTLGVLGHSSPPVFLKIHGSNPAVLSEALRPVRILGRYVLTRSTAIGVLSSTQRGEFISAGVPEDKVSIVRNALPAPLRPTQSRESFLAAHGLPGETPLLLFISRLVRAKGLLDTVRACGHLRDRGRRFVLCCVGDGPVRAEAEAEVARLGLDERVRFLGYVPEAETSDFYCHSDVLVFPTFRQEGLPVVLLKSLAAGLPIVTTRTRGAIDYLSEPDTCLWVEAQCPENVADRVDELLHDPALRHAMGNRARELARTFEPVAVAREYVAVYERLGANRPACTTADAAPASTSERDAAAHP
jgi:glycosyltransferase involved in cell wall biosynthesis